MQYVYNILVKKDKLIEEEKKKGKLLLMLWFAGITGFFIMLSNIFFYMARTPGHNQFIVYEPAPLIFWTEISAMLFVLIITVWIFYNYVSGKGMLNLMRKR